MTRATSSASPATPARSRWTATARSSARSTTSAPPRPRSSSAPGSQLDDIDLFVYHQANRRILAGIAERLGIEDERVVDAIAHAGNTSAASLPLALDAARRDGRLRPGARVLLGAVGSGFTWGAGVMTW